MHPPHTDCIWLMTQSDGANIEHNCEIQECLILELKLIFVASLCRFCDHGTFAQARCTVQEKILLEGK